MSAAVAAAASTASGTESRQLRVAFVTTTGDPHGGGIAQAAYEGFVRAVKRLGLKGKVEEVAPFPKDPKGAYVALAQQRYDAIVDETPFFDPRELSHVAAAFPRTTFLVPDVTHAQIQGAGKNVQTFVFSVEETAYLAGYLAASMERRRPGQDVIGSVGFRPVPQVDRFIAGYQAGARRADPGVLTLNGYSHDPYSPAKCRAVALAQISRGAGVIFPVAGACGLGALEAAKAKHVWGIGVDVDQSPLGPHILTSVVKRWDVAMDIELGALKRGTLPAGGTTFLGLRENGVGLGRISPKVPGAVLRKLDAVRALVAAGKIRVPSRLG